MKKTFVSLFLLGFFILPLITGCSQTNSSSSSTPVPASTLAQSIGNLACSSLASDNTIMSVSGMSVKNIKANSITTPEVGTDDWWNTTYTHTNTSSSGSVSYLTTYYFKVWRSDGTLVNTTTLLDNTNSSNLGDIWIYINGTVTDSASTTNSYSVNLGTSKSNPLKFTGYNSSSKTLSGPLTFSGSYNSESFSVSITYNNITLSSSGYPSGNVSFSIAVGSTNCQGNIAFTGTNSATITFTSGVSGTYTVNLDTATVTAAGL